MRGAKVRRPKRVKPCRKTIGLTVRGLGDPEMYTVSDDVYQIIRKLLTLNQVVGPYRGAEQVDFEELRFLLPILGVQPATVDSRSDLWIAEG